MNELFAYFIASAQCAVFILSFYGMGVLVNGVCRFRQGEHGDAPPLLVVGFATFVILGGFLSAFKLVSFSVLFLVLILGVTAAVLKLRKSNPPLPHGAFHFKKTPSFWFAIPFLLLFIFDSSLILMPMYHGQDDYQGYLVISRKLWQRGWFGEDSIQSAPFGKRARWTQLFYGLRLRPWGRGNPLLF